MAGASPSAGSGVGPMPPIDEVTRLQYHSQVEPSASPNPVRRLEGALDAVTSTPGSETIVRPEYLVSTGALRERDRLAAGRGPELTQQELFARQDYEMRRIEEMERDLLSRRTRHQDNLRWIEVDRQTAEVEYSAEQLRLHEEVLRLERELDDRRRNYERQESEIRQLRLDYELGDRRRVVEVIERQPAYIETRRVVEVVEEDRPVVEVTPPSSARGEFSVPLVHRDDLEYGYQGETKQRRINMALAFGMVMIVAALSSYAAHHIAHESRVEYESKSGYFTGAVQPSCRQNKDHVLYIGIPSPPHNFQHRLLARREWVYRAREDFVGRVKIMFIIGQTPIQSNDPSISKERHAVATQEEKTLELRLQDESVLYKDIQRIPVSETLTDKRSSADSDTLLWIFKKAVEWEARFVMAAHELQVVPVVDTVVALEKRGNEAPPVYFGEVWTHDTSEEPDGNKSAYYSGPCYGVSADLACGISVLHLNHSVGYPLYSTGIADVNAAKWIHHEMTKWTQVQYAGTKLVDDHTERLVQRLELPNLCSDYEGPESLSVNGGD